MGNSSLVRHIYFIILLSFPWFNKSKMLHWMEDLGLLKEIMMIALQMKAKILNKTPKRYISYTLFRIKEN